MMLAHLMDGPMAGHLFHIPQKELTLEICRTSGSLIEGAQTIEVLKYSLFGIECGEPLYRLVKPEKNYDSFDLSDFDRRLLGQCKISTE